MSLPVRSTPQADAQAALIDRWWREHRPASPDLFVNELSAAVALLVHAPGIGRVYRLSPVAGVRRLLLRRSRHHVYYALLESEVLILAVWHAERGSGPPLAGRP